MSFNKPKIIIVDNSYYYTGAFKAILSSVVALSYSYEFVFVLPRKTRIANLVRDNKFKVKTLPFIELSRRPRDVLFYFPILLINGLALARFVLSYKARIIHVNDYYNLTGTVAKLFLPSIKLVTHIRKLPNSFPSILNHFWLAIHKTFSDQIIGVSKAVKKQLPPGYPARLVYDGIAEKEKLTSRVSQFETNDPIKFLYLGHFIPGKGQDYALEAFREAYKACNNILLRFVGGEMGLKKNRKFRESLKKKTLDWGLSELVQFDGPTKDVEKEIKEADIVLNFSESESFSFVCLETLYYGTPLIASDYGGPSELCQNHFSGLLVPNKNVEEMSKAMIHLSKHHEERKKYSTNGKKFVRENFAFRTTVKNFNRFYNEMLNMDYN